MQTVRPRHLQRRLERHGVRTLPKRHGGENQGFDPVLKLHRSKHDCQRGRHRLRVPHALVLERARVRAVQVQELPRERHAHAVLEGHKKGRELMQVHAGV